MSKRNACMIEGDPTEAATFRQKILRKLSALGTVVRGEDIHVLAFDGRGRAVVDLPDGKFRWFMLLVSGEVRETKGYP